jgi:hypothetical protein
MERATRHCGKPDLGLVRGRFGRLRLAARPPHPDLLHSPSQTGVNALMARGEKEPAQAGDRLQFLSSTDGES